MENFTDLFMRDRCIVDKCNNYIIKFGYCNNHTNNDKINKFILDFTDFIQEICRKNNTEEIEKFYNLQKKLNIKIKEITNFIDTELPRKNCHLHKQHLLSNKLLKEFASELNYTNLRFDYENILKFIDGIDYEDITRNSDIAMSNFAFVCWMKENCTKNIKLHYKMLLAEQKLISNLLIIKNKNLNKYTVHSSINNNILSHIMNHKIYKHILYITTEHPINLKGIREGKSLRTDIYILIKSKDMTILEIFIELDDNGHYTKKSIHTETDDHDVYKDIYCLRNGISVCRWKCGSVINKKDKKGVINYLKKVRSNNFPTYHFTKEYINSKMPTKKGIYITL